MNIDDYGKQTLIKKNSILLHCTIYNFLYPNNIGNWFTYADDINPFYTFDIKMYFRVIRDINVIDLMEKHEEDIKDWVKDYKSNYHKYNNIEYKAIDKLANNTNYLGWVNAGSSLGYMCLTKNGISHLVLSHVYFSDDLIFYTHAEWIKRLLRKTLSKSFKYLTN